MDSDDSDSTPLMVFEKGKLPDEEMGLDHSNEKNCLLSQSVTARIRKFSRWSPIEQGITLSWRDLSIYARTKNNLKRIINNVNGAVKAGSLVALMGSSGAGKSTLMSTLAQRNSGDLITDGAILINGKPCKNHMKFLSGYMYQEDLFVGSLTVWEHMNIMSHLKLDSRMDSKDKQKKILQLLHDLSLSRSLHTKIQCLSGGEKKRLSFATELLTDPPVLFCDEPTSGLDSFSTQKLINLMNSMTSLGKTIICTIHQPSSFIFSMFSQIILLAEGRTAYFGPAAGAKEFFESQGYSLPMNYNPAEFYIKTLSIQKGDEENCLQTIRRICDNFVVSDFAKEVDVVVQFEYQLGKSGFASSVNLRSNFHEIHWTWKLFWLTYRWWLEILRRPSIQIIKILQKIAVGAMIGLCYFGTEMLTQDGIQSVQGAIFTMVTENTFNPMYSVLAEFPENTPLFIREYKSGLYHPLIYYLSRIFAMVPGLIVEPFFFAVFVYWLSGLKNTISAFLTTTLISTLTINVSVACGIFFSNCFDSVPTAMSYLVPFDCMLLMTSGVFIKLDSLSFLVSWTKYLSWLMYSTECMTIIQWSGATNISCPAMQSDVPCITDGSQVLAKYGFLETNFTRNLISLIAMIFVFYCLGFYCLWKKSKKK